jgi:hypothetical protein
MLEQYSRTPDRSPQRAHHEAVQRVNPIVVATEWPRSIAPCWPVAQMRDDRAAPLLESRSRAARPRTA